MDLVRHPKNLTPDFCGRLVALSSLFGGGGGNSQASMFQALQTAAQLSQQQAAITNSQGQQLALLSKQQATSDNETASMQKPGLGRALLAYNQKNQSSSTLGGS